MKSQKRKITAAVLLAFVILCAACEKPVILETMAQDGRTSVTGEAAEKEEAVPADGAEMEEPAPEGGAVMEEPTPEGGTVMKEQSPADSLAEKGSAAGNGSGTEETVSEDGLTEKGTAPGNGSAGEETGFSRQPVKVRGIYITGPMAGHSRMQELIRLVEDTELNAMVIDVKNDEGIITYDMPLAQAQEAGAVVKYVPDMKGLVDTLHEKGIYAIARIVAFKDPKLAEVHPEWAVRKKDGEIYRDGKGLAWVNPYRKEVWEYLIGAAKEAAAAGFDEIQFDYIRFATDLEADQVDFGPEAQKKSKTQIITEFTAYAYEALHPLNVFVSADVYGTIMDSTLDQSLVGQDYAAMARNLDYVCPMVYPSHYRAGSYDIAVPDADPYTLIYRSMRASRATLAGQMYDRSAEGTDRLGRPLQRETVSENNSLSASTVFENNGRSASTVSENNGRSASTVSKNNSRSESPVQENQTVSGNAAASTAVSGNDAEKEAGDTKELLIGEPPAGWKEPRAAVRPWLQAFTATWVQGHIPYGAEQIRDQIRAVYDAGYEEWILWNARNTYTDEGLAPAEK